MKINVEVDVTPEEARRFLGLPDVAPVQELVMKKVEEQVEKGLDGSLLPSMMNAMVTGGIQSMEAYQKLFSQLLNRSASGKGNGHSTS